MNYRPWWDSTNQPWKYSQPNKQFHFGTSTASRSRHDVWQTNVLVPCLSMEWHRSPPMLPLNPSSYGSCDHTMCGEPSSGVCRLPTRRGSRTLIALAASSWRCCATSRGGQAWTQDQTYVHAAQKPCPCWRRSYRDFGQEFLLVAQVDAGQACRVALLCMTYLKKSALTLLTLPRVKNP